MHRRGRSNRRGRRRSCDPACFVFRSGAWLSLARALGSGPRGRRFKSCRPDFSKAVAESGVVITFRRPEVQQRRPKPTVHGPFLRGAANANVTEGSFVPTPQGPSLRCRHSGWAQHPPRTVWFARVAFQAPGGGRGVAVSAAGSPGRWGRRHVHARKAGTILLANCRGLLRSERQADVANSSGHQQC